MELVYCLYFFVFCIIIRKMCAVEDLRTCKGNVLHVVSSPRSICTEDLCWSPIGDCGNILGTFPKSDQ